MDLRIRPYAIDDAPALHEAARESVAEIYPWLPWCHADIAPAETRGWIEGQVEAFAKGTEYQFAILDLEGRFLGGCGLNYPHPLHRMANLGYWLRTSAAGRGVMLRAVRLLAEWAFEHTDLERLEIVVNVGNVRSQRVAEKAGALREGTLRSRLFTHGRSHDAIMYSLVREPRRE